jgi:hypothetical protein
MIHKPIKDIDVRRRAHTLTEVLIASVLAVMVITSVLGVFIMAKKFYATGIKGQELQRDVNEALNRMIKGRPEGGARYGLRSAVSYTIPSASQSAPSIDFIGADGSTRTYYLTAGGIIYDSQTQAPNPQAIYSPPANSVVTLLFWWPYADHETLAIYLGVTEQVSGRTIAGSVATYINARNMNQTGA